MNDANYSQHTSLSFPLENVMYRETHCTLYTVHCTLYTVHCTLYTVQDLSYPNVASSYAKINENFANYFFLKKLKSKWTILKQSRYIPDMLGFYILLYFIIWY